MSSPALGEGMVIICDYLGVTVPELHSRALQAELRPFLLELGAGEETPGVWRCPGGGTVKLHAWATVVSVGVSGAALERLRGLGAFTSLLSILGAFPHTVTRLDAALDVFEHAPPILETLYAQALAGRIRLGRKALGSRGVKRHLGPALYAEGVETGTVYLGRRGDRVYLCVYDKRQERLERAELDTGPWVRYELRLDKRVGCTLRDAQDPGPVFWSVMGGQVLPCPEGVPDWVSWAEGYTLPRYEAPEPSERLRRACERSEALGGLCQLALPLGEVEGLKALQSHVGARYRLVAHTAAFQAVSQAA